MATSLGWYFTSSGWTDPDSIVFVPLRHVHRCFVTNVTRAVQRMQKTLCTLKETRSTVVTQQPPPPRRPTTTRHMKTPACNSRSAGRPSQRSTVAHSLMTPVGSYQVLAYDLSIGPNARTRRAYSGNTPNTPITHRRLCVYVVIQRIYRDIDTALKPGHRG